jgi:hypothetical protein
VLRELNEAHGAEREEYPLLDNSDRHVGSTVTCRGYIQETLCRRPDFDASQLPQRRLVLRSTVTVSPLWPGNIVGSASPIVKYLTISTESTLFSRFSLKRNEMKRQSYPLYLWFSINTNVEMKYNLPGPLICKSCLTETQMPLRESMPWAYWVYPVRNKY